MKLVLVGATDAAPPARHARFLTTSELLSRAMPELEVLGHGERGADD